ncbi:MAG: CopD family protein [Halomonas sp.]|uniref:CopD family protein n=1 Tax=Halomonas sp. TaxID=1486246 RepID=UPI001A00BF7E|nr:CopD family protein [Halomonas sp.]MBE0487465.1 CopD family protein [Halomonas sp.]
MPWIKFLHIIALVSWCGLLLYLPALLCQLARPERVAQGFSPAAPPLPRLLYNSLASPAALLTIASGTLLFLLHDLAGPWLVLKLLAVSAMVLAHGLCGWLLLRLEHGQPRWVAAGAMLTGGVAGLAMLAVVGLVLAKPEL